jgi:hypothetical protein
MSEEPIGYIQVPKNSNGIVRSKTTAQLRAWILERSLKQLDKVNENEWGRLEFPSLYILFEKRKAYIGEAKSVYARTKDHMVSAESKIKNWDKILIINDGRPATQSDFNDIVVRRALEDYLIHLFKLNKYTVVSHGTSQQLTSIQKAAVDHLKKELNFFLQKENRITKLFAEVGEEEVHLDELKKVVERAGKNIGQWGAHYGIIDGIEVFIRPGSLKKKGWQITFRDVFKDALEKGKGALLVPRGKVLLIPFTEIQKVIKDKKKYQQNTIDIYLQFSEEGVSLSYGDAMIDVTGFCLIKEGQQGIP